MSTFESIFGSSRPKDRSTNADTYSHLPLGNPAKAAMKQVSPSWILFFFVWSSQEIHKIIRSNSRGC